MFPSLTSPTPGPLVVGVGLKFNQDLETPLDEASRERFLYLNTMLSDTNPLHLQQF
jgi:hypothetical protein